MTTLYHRKNNSDLDTAIAVVDSVCFALQGLKISQDRNVSINWFKIFVSLLVFDMISTLAVLSFVVWLVFVHF